MTLAGSTSAKIKSAFSTATCARSRIWACPRGWPTTICARPSAGSWSAASARSRIASRRSPRIISFEPCFCRPGEGHDKGGVEARGKAVRLQALVPIPSGPTLEAINTTLLAQLDARREQRRAGHAQTIGELFLEEQRSCGRRGAVVGGGDDGRDHQSARARAGRGRDLLGAVPVGGTGSRRRGLARRRSPSSGGPASASCIRGSALASGRSTIATICRRSREKPQAVRQVLPDLLRDLGAPFPAVWDQLTAAHGPRDAARILAKILGHLETRGAAIVVPIIEQALASGTPPLLALAPVPTSCALPRRRGARRAARRRGQRRLRRRL